MFEQSHSGKKGVKWHQQFQKILTVFSFCTLAILSTNFLFPVGHVQAHDVFLVLLPCRTVSASGVPAPCAFELPRAPRPSHPERLLLGASRLFCHRCPPF